jgi:hypothetical protein
MSQLSSKVARFILSIKSSTISVPCIDVTRLHELAYIQTKLLELCMYLEFKHFIKQILVTMKKKLKIKFDSYQLNGRSNFNRASE